MKKVWGRRFKEGNTTFPTKAFVEGDALIIQQSENCEGRHITNSVIIPLVALKEMLKKLEIG